LGETILGNKRGASKHRRWRLPLKEGGMHHLEKTKKGIPLRGGSCFEKKKEREEDPLKEERDDGSQKAKCARR